MRVHDVRAMVFVLSATLMVAGCHQTGPHAASEVGASPGSSTPASRVQWTPPTSASAPQSALVAYVPSGPAAKLIYSCNVESVDGAKFGARPIHLPTGVVLTVSGWAYAHGVAEPEYWLRLDDEQAHHFFQVPLAMNVKRPDVTASVNGAPLTSGFSVTLKTTVLSSGTYHVYIVANTYQHKREVQYICDNGRHIEVGA